MTDMETVHTYTYMHRLVLHLLTRTRDLDALPCCALFVIICSALRHTLPWVLFATSALSAASTTMTRLSIRASGYIPGYSAYSLARMRRLSLCLTCITYPPATYCNARFVCRARSASSARWRSSLAPASPSTRRAMPCRGRISRSSTTRSRTTAPRCHRSNKTEEVAVVVVRKRFCFAPGSISNLNYLPRQARDEHRSRQS